MIDLSNCKEKTNTYLGADDKIRIIYQGEQYMLKFGSFLEPDPKKPLQGSYSNTPISEHLGSRIFAAMGIPAQDTFLATYNGRMAVACKDFIYARPDWSNCQLVEFHSLETSFMSGSKAGRTPLYEALMSIFERHATLEPVRQAAKERYWQMFVGDALVGNFDRHTGNWGYVLDRERDQIVDLAPVYDCGSCFYPKMSEQTMMEMLANPEALKKRVLKFPTASLRVNPSQRVRYHDFLLMPEGEECRKVLFDLYQNIDMEKIVGLIQHTEGLSDVQREFHSALVEERYESIIQPGYELAEKEHSRKRDRDFDKDSPSLSEAVRESSAARDSDLNAGARQRDRNDHER